MSISAEQKKDIMKAYAISENDTGSATVQSAVLTTRIANLTQHLKQNHKDHSSRRGLLMLVGRRRRLLNYIKSQSLSKYLDLISKLGIRK